MVTMVAMQYLIAVGKDHQRATFKDDVAVRFGGEEFCIQVM